MEYALFKLNYNWPVIYSCGTRFRPASHTQTAVVSIRLLMNRLFTSELGSGQWFRTWHLCFPAAIVNNHTTSLYSQGRSCHNNAHLMIHRCYLGKPSRCTSISRLNKNINSIIYSANESVYSTANESECDVVIHFRIHYARLLCLVHRWPQLT